MASPITNFRRITVRTAMAELSNIMSFSRVRTLNKQSKMVAEANVLIGGADYTRRTAKRQRRLGFHEKENIAEFQVDTAKRFLSGYTTAYSVFLVLHLSKEIEDLGLVNYGLFRDSFYADYYSGVIAVKSDSPQATVFNYGFEGKSWPTVSNLRDWAVSKFGSGIDDRDIGAIAESIKKGTNAAPHLQGPGQSTMYVDKANQKARVAFMTYVRRSFKR